MWKVMLADDEPYVREGLEKLIPWKELGCELVFQARNGKELMDKMEEERPDIVIVDIKMPVMGGLEVAACVEEKGWNTKVIILTAYADFDYARQALRCKAADYVIKTAALDEIPRVLRNVTGRLNERRPAMYQLLLLYGLTERGAALCRIVSSCFEKEDYTGAAAGEKGYNIVLVDHRLTEEELFVRCRRLLDLVEGFLGQRPCICVSRPYWGEGETAETCRNALAYLESHDTQKDRIIYVMEEKEEKAPEPPPESGRINEADAPENAPGKELEDVTDLVEKTQRLIEKLYCSRLTLVELAERVHANPSYLSRLYKQKKGENLFDAINRMRIDRAKEYIEEQNRRIYEIAELVGFEDTAYFSRVFKKLEGVSPKEYDRRCRNKRELNG